MRSRSTAIGLRARLLLLVLFAVLPAFGLIGYTAISQRQQAALDTEQNALNLVRLAAHGQSQLIASTRQLLTTLAQLPVVRESSAASCSRLLAELRKPYPYYTNFGAAALDGRVFCSALLMARPVNIADRSYFQRSLQLQNFSIGDYLIGRVTGINSVTFGYPVRDGGENIRGVVFASLNLSWLNKLIAGVQLPEGSTLTVVDSRGTVLAHHPEPEKWVGKSLPDTPIVKTMLTRQREGTAEVAGTDGVVRLYAFAPLHEEAGGNVYISVGIPKAVAFAAVDRAFIRNIVLLALVALLALAAAWVGSDVFVLQRVNALAVAARRLAGGDLSARTGLPHGTEELGQLARSFDDMTAGLQRVNRALKTLSAGNRTLVRATDEPALLADMCRIIVEVGGYRCAWVGYAEQNQEKSVRPVAQTGFEGGLDTLIEATRSTWADMERGRGPMGTAIRTGQPCVVRNILTDPNFAPWREEASRRGYASCVAFPLAVHGKVVGALAIYSQEPDAFDTEELELLRESAEDLAFGIATLRTRVEHEQAHETIRRMAYYDRLTGLPNHIHFEERLQRALSEAALHGQSLALLLLDLNRFQEINDALGFQQGDLLFKDVGMRIRRALTEDEILARMRGDEFAVLLPGSDAARAAETALRILAALEQPFVLSDLALDVSAAVGITLFPQHGTEASRLIRHADVAMHQAKKSGKNYAVYAAEEDEDSPLRLALAGELRRAIEQDELVLYYQPKIDIRDGAVCGAEALVRWVHPQRGMIPPDEFIPLAEHTGLIKPLTDWVLEAALRQSSAWRETGLVMPIAVNLSARNLQDAELLDKIERLFVEWGADAGWLELEITESAIMDDPEGALEILRRMSERGIALFIDDFGTGYSSLGYLKKLPVDAVKIDKSFISDMLTDAGSAAIVRSTIGLSHDLSLKVVAEGVENQTTWDRLAALGCDTAQGYHISKPLPADRLEAWLAQRAQQSKRGRGFGRT